MFPAWIFIASLVLIVSATTCFDYQGNPVTSISCDPVAPISNCCNGPDYCMSNGLCLDAGANNLFAIRGCTSQNWEAPCHNYCNGTNPVLFPCPGTFGGGDVKWCCGGPQGNATLVNNCCESEEAFLIPVGTVVLREDQISAAIAQVAAAASTSQLDTLSTSTVSPTTSGTDISTSTPTEGIGSDTFSSTSPHITGYTTTSSPSPPSSDKSLAVGLGVGIPLSIIVSVTLGLLAWELRRYNNRRVAGGCAVVDLETEIPVPVTDFGTSEMEGQNEHELVGDSRGHAYELDHHQNG